MTTQSWPLVDAAVAAIFAASQEAVMISVWLVESVLSGVVCGCGEALQQWDLYPRVRRGPWGVVVICEAHDLGPAAVLFQFCLEPLLVRC